MAIVAVELEKINKALDEERASNTAEIAVQVPRADMPKFVAMLAAEPSASNARTSSSAPSFPAQFSPTGIDKILADFPIITERIFALEVSLTDQGNVQLYRTDGSGIMAVELARYVEIAEEVKKGDGDDDDDDDGNNGNGNGNNGNGNGNGRPRARKSRAKKKE